MKQFYISNGKPNRNIKERTWLPFNLFQEINNKNKNILSLLTLGTGAQNMLCKFILTIRCRDKWKRTCLLL